MSSDQLKMYNALLGWHGTQLLSADFLSYLIDEGILFDDEGGKK